ncbi:MAG TPA: hypothetical protein VFN11_03250 [Ktedonobacterales bacterium]|nr:hypothetical protein [Ktedonobacterales bacterium]
MALERDDLDELNRPPRRIRAMQTMPVLVAAGTETQNNNGHKDHGERQMGEPTLGEILLGEMRDLKDVVSKAMTEQARMRVQVDMHEADLRDIKTWRDGLSEKRRQQQQQDQAVWWQTTNGRINIALAALVLVTTVAPFVAQHWH